MSNCPKIRLELDGFGFENHNLHVVHKADVDSAEIDQALKTFGRLVEKVFESLSKKGLSQKPRVASELLDYYEAVGKIFDDIGISAYGNIGNDPLTLKLRYFQALSRGKRVEVSNKIWENPEAEAEEEKFALAA